MCVCVCAGEQDAEIYLLHGNLKLLSSIGRVASGNALFRLLEEPRALRTRQTAQQRQTLALQRDRLLFNKPSRAESTASSTAGGARVSVHTRALQFATEHFKIHIFFFFFAEVCFNIYHSGLGFSHVLTSSIFICGGKKTTAELSLTLTWNLPT